MTSAFSLASARWLLDWLDRFEELARTHGQLADDAQRDEVIAVIERARPYYQARATRLGLRERVVAPSL